MTDDPPRRADRPKRARPRIFGEWPFALVLTGVAAGLVVIGVHHFKRGSAMIAAALLLAAVLRLVLPEHRAGMLVVRNRVLDLLTLVSLGGLIAIAAAVVPPL